MLQGIGRLVLVVAVCASAATASASIVMDTVTVGNPGQRG